MKIIIVFLILSFGWLLSANIQAQELQTNLFVRTPQVVNFNMDDKQLTYNPLISIGVGFSHKAKFIEIGAFTGSNNQYGFYTFFGTTLKSKSLGNNWFFNTNWFGEITHIPRQGETLTANIYTSGFCFLLYYAFDWGSIGLPLCIGSAYNNGEFSLNTRTIFNASINLH